MNADFTVFDIESTGYGPDGVKEMIELAAVSISHNKIIGDFHSLVNPERPITWQARRVHGITDDMVKSAPEKYVVLDRFFQFAADSILVAHNAQNDIKFLLNAGMKIDTTVVDTLRLSKLASPNERRHDLDTLVVRWAVTLPGDGKRHRALFDAQATALVFLKILEKLTSTYTIQQIISKCEVFATIGNTSELKANSYEQGKLF